MKRTIWKYTLRGSREAKKMPQGAQILTAAEQRGDICVWALVDPTAPLVERAFTVVGTGKDADHLTDAAQYVGTVLLVHGALVFHVFDLGEVA